MGGEVIIIAQDPDVVLDPPGTPIGARSQRLPVPKIQVTQVSLKFTDHASPDEVALAVRQALSFGDSLKGL